MKLAAPSSLRGAFRIENHRMPRLSSTTAPIRLAFAAEEAQACQPDAQQRERGRLRNRVAVTDLPRLRAGAVIVAARSIGEVRGEIVVRRILDEVVGAQAAAGDVELQIAEIGIAGAVTRSAVDRDSERPKRSSTPVGRAQAEHAEGVSAIIAWLDEVGGD